MENVLNKRMLFTSIIIIALGVVLSTTLKESTGSLGIVFIAVGGLLFILSIKNQKEKENKDKREQ